MSKYLKKLEQKLEQKFMENRPPVVPFHSKPNAHHQAQPPLSNVNLGSQAVNAVYYPNYRVYRGDTPAKMNYNCISHVFYAFAHVAPEGHIFLSDEWADIQMEVDGSSKGCLGSFAVLKQQYPHLKVILSVGGGAASQNFAIVAASSSKRHVFATSARSLMDTHNLDGIDIDWEHPSTPAQGQDFISLLTTLRTHLPSPRYLLTAALPAGEWALKNINLQVAQQYLDFINLMAYDFTGSWTPKAGHHAQLYPSGPDQPSASAAVNYLLSCHVAPHKLILGIPVYGRSFLGATRVGESHCGHGGEEGTFEYKELPRHGCQEVVDRNAVAVSSIGADGGFVTYDNVETVGIKGQYARGTGLGGLFYWTGTADLPGPKSLIEAGYRSLHSC